MFQYDVFTMPVAASRRDRPYVLVLQHQRVSFARTVVIAPLSRPDRAKSDARILPTLLVLGAPFVLIAHELTVVPAHALRGDPIDNLESYRYEIMGALDFVFSAAG